MSHTFILLCFYIDISVQQIIDVVVAVLAGGGVSVGVVTFLSKKLVEHRLAKDLEDKKRELLGSLEDKKGDLAKELEREKNQLQISLEDKKREHLGSLEDKKREHLGSLEDKKGDLAKELEREKNRLQISLETKKGDLQQILEKNKIEWKADADKILQEYLGAKSAEREYELEARKRLYHSIGSLRFELLVACKEIAERINNYGDYGWKKYTVGLGGYYGRNTLYKILHPIAIAELIERQIAYADFFVDEQGVQILKFQKASFTAFTDGGPILNHPNIDWDNQIEHLYSGTLKKLANKLVISDEKVASKERPMRFHEFDEFVKNPQSVGAFSPISDILEKFQVSKHTIFWVRLVCFGYICNEYVGILGSKVGFEKVLFDTRKLLKLSPDSHILSNIDQYTKKFEDLIKVTL